MVSISTNNAKSWGFIPFHLAGAKGISIPALSGIIPAETWDIAGRTSILKAAILKKKSIFLLLDTMQKRSNIPRS
jgi:hypothetical protein